MILNQYVLTDSDKVVDDDSVEFWNTICNDYDLDKDQFNHFFLKDSDSYQLVGFSPSTKRPILIKDSRNKLKKCTRSFITKTFPSLADLG